MSNPVVLITGALTGIGHATALAFARSGARLVVSGRRQAEGKALPCRGAACWSTSTPISATPGNMSATRT